MAFYLLRDDEVVARYTARRWQALLELAQAYDWRFAGVVWEAEAYQHRKTSLDDYQMMAHQLVTTEDARNLADALERALVHFPRKDEELTLNLRIKTNLWSEPTPRQQQALNWFLKDEQVPSDEEQAVQSLIACCRNGEFRIA